MQSKWKRRAAVLAACVLGVLAGAAVGCGGEKEIAVIAREASSGTREAFDKFAKLIDENKNSLMTKRAEEFDSTGAVKTKVASTKTAIGYVSLSALDDSVKAVKVEGVEATVANVLNDSYKLQRPFVIMTNKSAALNALTADFLAFCQSSQAETPVTAEGGVFLTDEAKRGGVAVGTYTADAQADFSGLVVNVRGSTSMEKVIKKCIEEYLKLNPSVTEQMFNIDLKGSSVGKKAAQDDTAGNVIGLSSSAVTAAADTAVLNVFNICLDAVAVIVHPDNALANVTAQNLHDIYTGAVTKFSAVQ